MVDLADRPKLRPVEAFLLGVVSLFDGEHSILDIQEAIIRWRGELLFREELDRILSMLDEHGFLDSPRFAERCRQLEEAFRQSPTRPALHAGTAYAREPEALRAQIAGFFTPPDGPGPPGPAVSPSLRAIIAPHIDFHRGGPVYAWAYNTPFGPAVVDREFADALSRRFSTDLLGSELAHRAEHSVEFQAVFLRYLFAGRREFTIVPILASFLHECLLLGKDPEAHAMTGRFLDALRETIASSGRKVCLVDSGGGGPRDA